MSVPEVVLLTRRPLERYPVWEWVKANVRVIAPVEHRASAARAPVEVHLVERYTDTAEVDLAVLDLARQAQFAHLIAMSEYDVLRAARLRTVLDLPGQRELSAAAYRDKVVMKSYWGAAGVAAARFAPVDAAADLIAFGRSEGWPIVVKPRRGSGSVGVTVIADEARARDWLRTHWRVGYDEVSPWMAEVFVDGRMFQVDGVYADGRCEVNWPTAVSSLLAWAEGGSTFSVALEPGDLVVPATRALVEDALRALPEPGGPIVYHAEVWQDAHGGGLLMNEIAARIGGGLTRPLIQAGFGVDLVRRFVEATLRPGGPGAAVPDVPHTLAGEIGVPPRTGVVTAVEDLSTRLSAPWVHTASVKPQVGQHYSGASDSVDTIAEAVVTGVSADQVRARLATVAGWFDSAIRYREPDSAAVVRHPQRVSSPLRATAGAY